jgi:2-C-methyl-D-erythritol 4-phosphate cytidylyltransferase
VVVAAGRGTRFGRPKQLVEIAGLPMVGWSIRTFSAMPEIDELIVVTENEWLAAMNELVAQLKLDRHVRVVEGGATRQESVGNGIAAVSRAQAVLIHDGARPLVRAHDVRAAMREVREGRGAVLASPVVDTIKVVDGASMTVRETLDRGMLWAAQTPQLAMLSDLRRAHAQAAKRGVDATDDVALLEALGIEVAVVPSTAENFKVTRPEDLQRAEMLLRESA